MFVIQYATQQVCYLSHNNTSFDTRSEAYLYTKNVVDSYNTQVHLAHAYWQKIA